MGCALGTPRRGSDAPSRLGDDFQAALDSVPEKPFRFEIVEGLAVNRCFDPGLSF